MTSGPTEPGDRRQVLVPVSLLMLSAIPLTAGVLRLVQLGGGPETIPADDRFVGVPVALVVHIVGAGVYAVLGAFQVMPSLRRRHRSWHRRSGRVLSVVAMLVVGSALWLTLFYPRQPGTGDLLHVFRLVVAAATGASLVLGVSAVRRRDIAAHRAWMIRAYALSLGAGTQVVTEGLGGALLGTGVLVGDLAKAAAWAINLAVAEWIVRPPARVARRPRQPDPARACDAWGSRSAEGTAYPGHTALDTGGAHR